MVEHALYVSLVNTRQLWEMHYVPCVLQAHTRRKLVRFQIHVLTVLLTRIRTPQAMNKQTAYATQGTLVQMESDDHYSFRWRASTDATYHEG